MIYNKKVIGLSKLKIERRMKLKLMEKRKSWEFFFGVFV